VKLEIHNIIIQRELSPRKSFDPDTIERYTQLTPKHEQLIRKTPKPFQDRLAEVILTREDPIGTELSGGNFPIPPTRRRVLTVLQTHVLVEELIDHPATAAEMLSYLLDHPLETEFHDHHPVEQQTNREVIAEWVRLYRKVGALRAKFDIEELALGLLSETNASFQIADIIHFLQQVLNEMEFLSTDTFDISDRIDD
jgi:hypothetical protein